MAKRENQGDLCDLICHFLYPGRNHPAVEPPLSESDLLDYEPSISDCTINIYPSMVAIFYSPSDIFAVNGICKEHICCVTKWRQGLA
jgi:hypothetical protein